MWAEQLDFLQLSWRGARSLLEPQLSNRSPQIKARKSIPNPAHRGVRTRQGGGGQQHADTHPQNSRDECPGARLPCHLGNAGRDKCLCLPAAAAQRVRGFVQYTHASQQGQPRAATVEGRVSRRWCREGPPETAQARGMACHVGPWDPRQLWGPWCQAARAKLKPTYSHLLPCCFLPAATCPTQEHTLCSGFFFPGFARALEVTAGLWDPPGWRLLSLAAPVLLSALRHAQPAVPGWMLQLSLGFVCPRLGSSHFHALARPSPGKELSTPRPPHVVFSFSTLESGSLALE